MNNIVKTVFLLLPVTVIGLYVDTTIINHADVELIIDDLIMRFIVLIFIIAFLWTLYKNIEVYIQTQLKPSFIPTVIGIIFITSFFVTNVFAAARDKSPILIQAGYDGEDNDGAWFEFREDGTYKFGNSGRVGARYSRGNYLLKDNLIVLDKENIDNTIQSKLLVIRKEKILDTLEQVIYQINQEHNIIDRDFKFTIYVDNRKK